MADTLTRTKQFCGIVTNYHLGGWERIEELRLMPAEQALVADVSDWLTNAQEADDYPDFDTFVPFLTVRWFSSPTPKSFDEHDVDLLNYWEGVGSLRFEDESSEATGYLWTEEWFKVGAEKGNGHDLIEELRPQIGKYACVEVTVAQSLS